MIQVGKDTKVNVYYRFLVAAHDTTACCGSVIILNVDLRPSSTLLTMTSLVGVNEGLRKGNSKQFYH